MDIANQKINGLQMDSNKHEQDINYLKNAVNDLENNNNNNGN